MHNNFFTLPVQSLTESDLMENFSNVTNETSSELISSDSLAALQDIDIAVNITQYEDLINMNLLAFDINELVQNLTSAQMVHLNAHNYGIPVLSIVISSLHSPKTNPFLSPTSQRQC